ncbi:MAG: FAD-binding protein [Shimia sp.]|nr:FAD-binding protein [Shimia sp.]
MSLLEFDYVIVGAGSAGCVLADRLTRCGRYTVLLLESGGSDSRFWVKVPIGYAINVNNPALNWGYQTAPDAGLNDRRIVWPRGRLIGGSSSINAMAYVRGLGKDFDDWEAAGALGWGWQNVKQIYERLETRVECSIRGRETIGEGPVIVSDLSKQMSRFSETFLSAARDMGHTIAPDMNAQDDENISFYRSTVRNGVRWSAADAFLKPAKKRPNLTVMQNADVSRLVHEDGRVSGVAIRCGGKAAHAKARGEVLLCAGAINSPKLMQISGLGPEEVLRRNGIAVRKNLPFVGRGLQDHLAISYQFQARDKTLNHSLGRPIGKLIAGVTYLASRRGPLAVPVNQVGGFVRSRAEEVSPDVQLYFNPVSYHVAPNGKTVVDRTSGYQISAQPCRPTSTGSIEIESSSPEAAPRIMPNSLSSSFDQSKAIAAGRVLQKYAQTDSLRAVTKAAKAPDLLALDGDALLEDFRQRASTVFHPTCTCRMGRTERDSVLDSRLRVHGVPGLRVVDASAFPNITSGNTNAPTMMLAMRAADLILEDAR